MLVKRQIHMGCWLWLICTENSVARPILFVVCQFSVLPMASVGGVSMVKSRSFSVSLALLLAGVAGPAINGCGTDSLRVLQSMSISPATADAAKSPDGKVQFTASGTFSRAPSPATVPFVDPYSGTWSVSNPAVATISQSGLAQCVPGASGTVDVMAIASANSTTGPRMSIAVTAKAKLTCP
jgi:Big-like domain-containing protein